MKIKELKIYTENFASQVDFYSKVIGFELVQYADTQATFQIGRSRLRIVKNDQFRPYHFAINIPSNQIKEALYWLKERVEILKDGSSEIQDFDFWNAKAIYFYDMDKNIVECIARNNLKNESQEKFSINSMLEISEIGLPVNNIETTFYTLNRLADVEKFDGGFERFCAIGNENGLFICINKQVKDWYPTGDKAYASEFEIEFVENERTHKLAFKNEEIRIKTDGCN